MYSMHGCEGSGLLGHIVRRHGQTDSAMIRTNAKQVPRQWTRRLGFVSTLMTGVLAAAAFGAGCESSVSSYCVARCDCQGCSQREREDCMDDIEDSERLAGHDECASEFAEYISCYTNEGSCMNGGWLASSCFGKGNELRSCSARSAKFVKSACQEEGEKRAACGLSGGGADPCSGVEECVAFCAVGTSCEELANPTEGSVYVNCVINCTSSGSSSSGGGP
jgi:hypothetical protein